MHTSKNWLLVKVPQFLSNLHETWSKWVPYEVIILTKFHEIRAKIVELLLIANFGMCPVFWLPAARGGAALEIRITLFLACLCVSPFPFFFGVSLCLPFSFSPVFYPKPLVVAQQLLSRCSAVSQQLLSSFSAVARQLLGCCSAITQHLGLHPHCIVTGLALDWCCIELHWHCIGIVLALHWDWIAIA